MSGTLEEASSSRGRLVFVFCHLLGHLVEATLKDGTIFEGVCQAISPDNFSLVLVQARLKHSKAHPNSAETNAKLRALLHIPATELFSLFASEVPFGEEGTEQNGARHAGFVTDGDIVKHSEGGIERELQPCPFLTEGSNDVSLDSEIANCKNNTSWDQFKVNEELNAKQKKPLRCHVPYDESLYTTRLNLKEFTAETIKRAENTAKEIEKGGDAKCCNNAQYRIERNEEVDRDYDEEELHSSVVRCDASERYVPPHKRSVTAKAIDPTEFLSRSLQPARPLPATAISSADVERQLLEPRRGGTEPLGSGLGSSLNPKAKEWSPPKPAQARPNGEGDDCQAKMPEWRPTLKVPKDQSVLGRLTENLLCRPDHTSANGGVRQYSHLWVKAPSEVKDFVYYIDLESIQDETNLHCRTSSAVPDGAAVEPPSGGKAVDGLPLSPPGQPGFAVPNSGPNPHTPSSSSSSSSSSIAMAKPAGQSPQGNHSGHGGATGTYGGVGKGSPAPGAGGPPSRLPHGALPSRQHGPQPMADMGPGIAPSQHRAMGSKGNGGAGYPPMGPPSGPPAATRAPWQSGQQPHHHYHQQQQQHHHHHNHHHQQQQQHAHSYSPHNRPPAGMGLMQGYPEGCTPSLGGGAEATWPEQWPAHPLHPPSPHWRTDGAPTQTGNGRRGPLRGNFRARGRKGDM